MVFSSCQAQTSVFKKRANWNIGKPAKVFRGFGCWAGVNLAVVIFFVSWCNFILSSFLPLAQRSILYQEGIWKGLDLLVVGWVAWLCKTKPPRAQEWSVLQFKHYSCPFGPPWHSSRWWAPEAGGILPAGWWFCTSAWLLNHLPTAPSRRSCWVLADGHLQRLGAGPQEWQWVETAAKWHPLQGSIALAVDAGWTLGMDHSNVSVHRHSHQGKDADQRCCHGQVVNPLAKEGTKDPLWQGVDGGLEGNTEEQKG